MIESLARVDSHNEYFLYRNHETGSDFVPNRSSFHDRPQPVPATSRPARIIYEQFVLPFVFARDRLDVVFNCGITAPLFTPLPMVTVMYDLQHKFYSRRLHTADRLALSFLFAASVRRSARLVLMTHAAELELTEHYPNANGKTFVVGHGVDRDFAAVANRERVARAERPFLLAVSSLMTHKNFDMLLRAFALLRKERPHLRLIIAGSRGADAGRLASIRDGLGLTKAVTFTGWIPRAALIELFAEADAFVFASRYEGFGIPVLEALTAGVPLACSDIPVLREIAGEAACYFDPGDAGSIARSLRQLLDDEALRERLRLAGLIRSQRFDWDRNVGVLMDAFEALAHPEPPQRNSTRAATLSVGPN